MDLLDYNVVAALTRGVSADEKVIATLLYERQDAILGEYKKLIGEIPFKAVLERLLNKGVLMSDQLDSKGKPIVNQEKLSEFLFPDPNRWFWEIFAMYPIKVPSPNGKGYRPLRAVDIVADSTVKAKAKYDLYIRGNADRHIYVVKCLEAELRERKRSNNMGYMVEFPVWVNQHSWDKYGYLIEENVGRSQTAEDVGGRYGEEEF